ncbi:MAG: zinc ribbon domain-containing protein [Coriobacteriales bacterium]|nr:zinc ribbon domain-containing protein [Coriobacteriales bacterium]
MPYCNHCGSEVPEDAQFCGSCGSPLKQTSSAPSRNKVALLVAIAVLLCVAIVLVIVALQRPTTTGQNSVAAQPASEQGKDAAASASATPAPADAASTSAESAAKEPTVLKGNSWSLALPEYWTNKVQVKEEQDGETAYTIYPLGQDTYPVASVLITSETREERGIADEVQLKDGSSANVVPMGGMALRFSVPVADGKYVAIQTDHAYAEVEAGRWRGLSQEQVEQMGDLQSMGKSQYSSDMSDNTIPLACLQEFAGALTVEAPVAKAADEETSSVSKEQQAIDLLQGYWISAGGMMNGVPRTTVEITGNTATAYSYAEEQGSVTIDPSRVERVHLLDEDGWYFHDLNRFMPDSQQGTLWCVNADGSGYSGTDSWGKEQGRPSYLP